jgi:uncharacterized protein with ParB-like and HNH nuclease domain
MQAQPTNMNNILGGPKQYVIPVFQRYYEWREERWKSLWQDLYALVEEYDNDLTHFIGPMVIVSQTVPTEVPRFLVIDGQQRLMTISVLLCAVRDRATALGFTNIAGSIEANSLTFFSTEGEKVPKIIPRSRDRDTLTSILRANYKQVDHDSLLMKAYQYFFSEIEKITPNQPSLFEGIPPNQALERINQVITVRLRVVSITLDNSDNPSNIYESLNFKGQSLSDADLIKNYIFMQLKKLNEQEEFEATVWRPFEELFGFNEAAKQSLTDFYYRYLITRTNYLARKRLYTLFTSYTDQFLKQAQIKSLVLELKRFARYFVAITRECNDPELEDSFKRFRKLETDTAIPLVLHLYERYDEEKITKSTFLTMLRVIESFILRRFILRERTRGYGLDFSPDVVKAERLNDLIRYFVNKGWPTDREVKDALCTFDFYRRSPTYSHLILTEIENSYGHKEKINLNDVTIDHVMPQTLTIAWSTMLGANADEIHEKYKHTIGNLTLTGYNTEMSNKTYDEKRAYYETSNLQLNKYFGTQPKWTEEEILARTEFLADKFTGIWERPSELSTPLPRTTRRPTASKKKENAQPNLIDAE